MKIINADTSLYGKLLKNKKIDFLEPAENFIRIFKQHLNKKKHELSGLWSWRWKAY